MGTRNITRIWVLLIVVLFSACQGASSSTSIGSTLIAQTSSNVPYPLQTHEPKLLLKPTQNPTPIPTISQSVLITNLPTEKPLPENTRSVRHFQPECIQKDNYVQCTDPLLGMKYKFPSRWGLINAELINGSCGGYYYGYQFDRSGSEVEAGGVSEDYCQPIGGNLFSLFKGFTTGRGCDEFPTAKECEQLNDNVVVATLFPDYESICSPGPGAITLPVMIIGINIPGDHPVAGLAFSVDFLSVKGKDKLFEPFGGVLINSEKCQEPKTKQIFTDLVDEIFLKVKQEDLDEETSYKVKGILDFANSITFTP